ncbi:MAG TPA: IS1380 family transposase [Mycobacterium sp.]|nr:IS1380 family transposase [Mycobacterium sp.]
MQLSHMLSSMSVAFDDPNLVSSAGLVPVLALADRCGLHELAAAGLSVRSPNPGVKVAAVVAGMVAGADSIDDLDRLRPGGMGRLFGGIWAPSTSGTFLRAFTFGHVKQLDTVAATLLVNLAGHTPLLGDVDRLCWVDVDDTVKQTYGYAKQGAGYGYTGIKGLNALIGVLSTPTSAPVIAATRLRKGSTSSPRGAASFVAATLKVARRCGASRLVVARMDSAFYVADVVAAIGRAGAKFSITARLNRSVRAAIAGIDEQGWTPIHYPNAIFDEQVGGWISHAEVAETSYTAFTSRGSARQVTARLIVRRVKLLPPAGKAQPALVEGHRHHAVFTDTTLTMLPAESSHRGHAIVEHVMADLKTGPLAHLPSGSFAANAAWLTLAAIAHNLTRAAGCLASTFHATARPATIGDQLINVPVRIASSARRVTLHLPTDWRWEHPWRALIAAVS